MSAYIPKTDAEFVSHVTELNCRGLVCAVIIYKMEFKLVLKLLSKADFIITSNNKLSKYRVFWLCITILSFIIIHTLMFIHYFYQHGTVNRKVYAFYFIFNGLITILRKAYVFYKNQEIDELLTVFQNSPDLESEDTKQMEITMRIRSSKTIKRYSFYLISSTIGAITTVIVMFLIFRVIASAVNGYSQERQKERLVLFLMWWPSNIRATPTYFFIVAWQCSVVVTYTVVSCASDAFLCAPMLAASERAGFLARAAPQALLPGRDGQVTPQFKAWVNYHQHYLEIIRKVNKLMGPLIMIKYFTQLFDVILFSFATITAHDMTMGLMTAVGLVYTLFQLYIVSRAGQQVIDQSVQLRHSVVGVAQVLRGALQAGHARNALQVLVTRLSGGARPEAVTGIGFFSVSMQLFSAVWSASVTYLFFLLSLRSSKNIFIYHDRD